jgi:hypothetical protein
MEDVLVMNVLQTEDCLCQPPQDLFLTEWLPTPLGLLNLLGEIATLTVVHQNAEPALICEVLAVAHDIWVLEVRQELTLLQCILRLSS